MTLIKCTPQIVFDTADKLLSSVALDKGIVKLSLIKAWISVQRSRYKDTIDNSVYYRSNEGYLWLFGFQSFKKIGSIRRWILNLLKSASPSRFFKRMSPISTSSPFSRCTVDDEILDSSVLQMLSQKNLASQ